MPTEIVAHSGSTLTDWIEAIATMFAAVGTVGAVVVALWQSSRRERRSLDVRCTTLVDEHGEYVQLVATNDGYRPVRIVYSPLLIACDRHGERISFIGTFVERLTDRVPKMLEEGEAFRSAWRKADLDNAVGSGGLQGFLCVHLTDAFGNVFEAGYPGVKVLRRRPWRRRTYSLPSSAGTERSRH